MLFDWFLWLDLTRPKARWQQVSVPIWRLWGQIPCSFRLWQNSIPRRCRTEVLVSLQAVNYGLFPDSRVHPHTLVVTHLLHRQNSQHWIKSFSYSNSLTCPLPHLSCLYLHIHLTSLFPLRIRRPMWLYKTHLDNPRPSPYFKVS